MKQNFSILAVLFGAILLAGCQSTESGDGDSKESNGNDKEVAAEAIPGTTQGKGGVMLGGTFTMAENDNYVTLFPPAIEDFISFQIASQVYESLLRYNPESLELEPSIAESYESNEDQTEFTFKIREGVKFHADPCFQDESSRLVTAQDVQFSVELICSGDNEMALSNYESIFRDVLVGAKEFHNGSASTISGLEVVDDYTIKFKLKQPSPSFLYKLGLIPTSIVAPEAYEKYGNDMKVGTGPFKHASEDDREIILTKNEEYYLQDEHGNQLPYLDTVKFLVVDSKSEQLAMFESGELSLIYKLPAEKVTEIVSEKIGEYNGAPPEKVLDLKPVLITQYYEFNMTRPHFKDVRVRKAFNYAIDRKKIIENVLKSQANKYGEYGITPPVKILKNYPFDSLKNYGYSHDPEKARALMAEAGYPNGDGFPILKLEINSGGRINNQVAKEVVKQIEFTLGININQEVVPYDQKLEDAKYGRADIFRSGWVADYPDPETFLQMFYGKNVPRSMDKPSHPNTMRYVNPEFDKYFEKARTTVDEDARMYNFYLAEKTMLEDAPIMPLWYEENYKLYYSYIRNFKSNALEHLDLSRVYLKKWTNDEWLSAHK